MNLTAVVSPSSTVWLPTGRPTTILSNPTAILSNSATRRRTVVYGAGPS